MNAVDVNPTPQDDDEDRRRPLAFGRLLATVAIVGIAGTTLTGLTTGAFFTDTQTVGANTFSTGTVKLGVNPTSALVTFTNMAPGDSIAAPITVSNTGSLAERYAVLSTTDAADANFLATQLVMNVKTGVTTCTAAGFGATGTLVYTNGVLGSTGGTKVIGDAATGAQAGDRTLASLSNETLCVLVSLPTATGNTFQGKTTTATLRFDSEQTANNP